MTTLNILLGTAILCLLILVASYYAKGDPVLAQWMRYVDKAAPLILGSIPNFPPVMIPVVVAAIKDAEEFYGAGEGEAKKKFVVQQASAMNIPATYEVPQFLKAIDTIIKMVNHASEISQKLDSGELTPPTKDPSNTSAA